MFNKKISRRTAIAMTLFCSIIFGGCVGTSDIETEYTQEVTTNPPFEMPGESVIEVTPELETTEHETTETQPQETVQVPVESDTEPVTETAAGVPSETKRVIVLDPGHGGVWVGALDGTYEEKTLALKTALYCRDYLLEHYENIEVYMTRETDIEFSTDQKADLEARVKLAKSYNAEILVSLHFNSDPSDLSNGALVCVSKQSWVNSEASALGHSILSQLSQLGLADKGLMMRDSDEYFDENGVSMDYYAICRHSASLGIPGIIVEHCFMRNEIDVPYYNTDEALQRLGQADAIGIAQYMGLQEQQ